MIKIVAIAGDDGWCIAKDNGKLFIMHPPYDKRREATERDVDKACGVHGFEKCDVEFETVAEVKAFLVGTYLQAVRHRGIKPIDLDGAIELLRYADDLTLLRFLNRAKLELLPKGKLSAARRIAGDILKLDRGNQRITLLATGIIGYCEKAERSGK